MSEETNNKPFTVVVAYDFSELAELALAEALALADVQPRAIVHVIAVLDGKQGLADLDIKSADAQAAEEVMDKLQARVVEVVQEVKPSDFYFYVHSRIGNAANAVVELAGEVESDLIIIGTHGRTGIKRMVLGSVAEKVARHAHCPVLVMRHKDYDPAERPTIEPEPADPPGQEHHFAPKLDPKRFAFTRDHQVMPLRPNDWPLW